MSDIPIGSPPVPPGRHAAPQGWYPDPVDVRRERYWDGWSWSRNTRQSEQPGPQPSSGQGIPSSGPHHPYRHAPHQAGLYQGAAQQVPGAVARTADGVPIAGWGWRFLAAVLDLIVVSIIANIFSIPIFITMLPAINRWLDETVAAGRRGSSMPPPLDPNALMSTNDQIMITLILIAVGLVYFGLFWRFRSASLGHLVCGLRIVPVDHGHSREPLTWGSAVIRALVWWVPLSVGSVLWIFAIANMLFPLGNVRRQAIHDLAAKTQIVKIK